MGGLIEESGNNLLEELLLKIETTLGRHAVKQARRMLPQRTRSQGFEAILGTDQGLDPELLKGVYSKMRRRGCHDLSNTSLHRALWMIVEFLAKLAKVKCAGYRIAGQERSKFNGKAGGIE